MISVVIPALNEKDAIEAAVQGARAALGEAVHEVIVVDDASSDGTGELAEAAGAKVLRHPETLGYGRSLKDGIEAAQYDTIVIADADGTYPLDAIPQLLGGLAGGVSMVVGARTFDRHREGLLMRTLRKLLKWLVEFMTGRRIPDVNSGMRAFRRGEILPFLGTLCDTFSFTTSLTMAYLMTGRTVRYVPIGYDERIGRRKVCLVRDSLRTLKYIVQAGRRYNRPRLCIGAGAIASTLVAVGFCIAWSVGPLAGSAMGIGVSLAILVALIALDVALRVIQR